MRAARAGEAGSAYIVALLALVVLTILGLALALVTQTEVHMGANERTVNRNFYAADSGLGVAAAEALASGRYAAATVILNRSNVGGLNTADRVRISPLAPILTVRCDWCPANDDGVPKFWKVHHAVTATSDRISWPGSGPPPADATLLGQKTLSVMFEFQPWPTPPVDSIADTEALQQIKF
ncbi:MAG TPA: pilus assembly PilX N-terminal domain-containing protein [Thermoanaerobaculia bacterium]|jgi:Tfp pilus assembly protein PilX|nr:pilus assembly PilX N-terminal domain-containing protein [Thermoanaerobaculia bacterium]